MAEPAWALRVRRARVRRYRARSMIIFNSQRVPALAGWLRQFLPGWLIAWLQRPLLRLLSSVYSRPALRAADAARSVLDGLPDPARSPQHWGQPAAGARHSRRRFEQARPATDTALISLRYAAHMVVVGLVAIVLLAAGASNWAGVMRLDPVAPTPANWLANADQAVNWAPPAGVSASDDTPAQPALRNPQPQFEPVFVATHELAEGETLGQLASRYRVSAASLFWANDLDRGDILAAGQALRIPRIDGVPHVIQPDETLESIAVLFHVAPQAIMLLGANGLIQDQPLSVGREIFIPGGTRPYPAEILARYGDEQGVAAMAAVAAGVVQESDTNLRIGPGRGYPRVGYLDAGHRLKLVARYSDWVKVDTGAAGAGWVRADLLGLPDATLGALPETNDFPPLPPRWMWPTRGSITSPFGWRRAPFRSFHDGLDIANAAGTRIYAARAGQVIEAGWCSGFGYCVKIDHGEGVTTIYGHMLKKPPVRVDDAVEAGDLIGFMGSTFDRSGGGYSTGVHLHFTVKVNGKAVNPLKFLP